MVVGVVLVVVVVTGMMYSGGSGGGGSCKNVGTLAVASALSIFHEDI